AQLAHVRDIEQAGVRAGMQMLGAQPGRTLDGHLEAGEAGHAGTEVPGEGVEGESARGVVHCSVSSQASIGGQVQTSWRSPAALSMRLTAGQTFACRIQGRGKAASSRE